MRISTEQVFEQQTAAIDNLSTLQAQYGTELSSGKQLNVPSDDPTEIAQDLAVRSDNAVTTQVNSNLTDLNNQLTTVDGALNSLTNIMQSANQLAIEAASDSVTPAQQKDIGSEVDQLLQEAVGLANTQYNGQYVFAGTASPTTPPVQAQGEPIQSVTSTGNEVAQTQELPGGQTVTSSVTLQQAFNFNSSNGTPDVFQTLINLRNTLNNGTVTDESASQVNVAGQYINPAVTNLSALAATVPPVLQTPLTSDGTGNISITISSALAPNGVLITVPAAATTVNGLLAAINAQTVNTGVTASFNAQTQRISLTSTNGTAFQIADASNGAAPNSNFVEAFNLQPQADIVNNLSTQLGDVNNALQVTLDTRSQIGSTIQSVQSLSSTASLRINNDTQVQSNIEDADIAQVVTQFSATQTALQAAYATTTRLETKTLFDYLQ